MNKKKIFGIGAVVFSIILIINPIVNSTIINETKRDYNLEFIDLEIKIDECSLVENFIPVSWHESSKVFYKLCYTITNYGPSYLSADKLNFKLKILGIEKYPDKQIIFEWTEFVENLDVGESIDLHHEFYNITSSWNPSEDEERYFAGKFFSLTLFSELPDPKQENNFDIGTIKFWSDTRSYEPTDSQVEVGVPHTYLNISINRGELWYYEFPFDPKNYSSPIRERLGYIWELFMFIYPICKFIKKIIIDFIEFAQTEKDDINILSCWIDDLITCLLCDIFGEPIPFGFINLLVDYFKYVKDAVERILEEAAKWLVPELINISQSIMSIVQDFEGWIDSEPWKNNITIQISVLTKKENHAIILNCRNTVIDDNGKTFYNFDFEVPPKFGNEIFTWTRKDCTVQVHNWQTNQDQHSMKLFSWAYANGTMRALRTISFQKIKVSEDIKLIIQKFFSKYQYFKNKLNDILCQFFLNFLNEDKYKEKSNNKNLNNLRDFDLDGLIKKVISEEKQYEPYDVEYKEYYPGAPHDSKIVYYSSDQVIVGFKPYVDITKIDEVEGYPIVDRLVELNTVVVEIYGIEPEYFMEIVNQSKDIEYTELNFVYQLCHIPNDPFWEEQWGPKAINCPQAWDKEKGEWTVSVAILDTGCNYHHEDISNKQSSVNYDFVNNDNDPMDDCYVAHGTHCSGIIGATIDNHKGIAGVAPEAWTDYIKILDNKGAGYASTIAKGIIHATKYNEQIISMSLGGYGLSIVLHLACDYARYIKGVLLVAAAGNDGLPILCFPARFESVISVGAIDKNLNLCSWSNYGPNLDLVAPGNNIISTVEGNNYEKLSGTSMATPHVAAVSALYFSANYGASATLCEIKLYSTAMDLGSPGNDWKYGYGLVDAYGVVKKARNISNNSQLLKFLPGIPKLLMNMRFQ